MNDISSVIAKSVNGLWLAALVFLYCDLRYETFFTKAGKGFYCDDVYIQKPFHGDTISFQTLIIVSIVSTVILIITIELVTSDRKGGLKSFLYRFKHCYKIYAFGLTYVGTITNLLKFLVRELRPHFIDSCRPDWSNINCSQGLVTKYNCTGNGPKWLVDKDIYQSFPSGHASVSFYTFVFVFFYIKNKFQTPTNPTSYLPGAIQFLFFAWAVICSVTRLTDCRHYWWDVLIGAFLGLTGAVIAIRYGYLNHFVKLEKNHER